MKNKKQTKVEPATDLAIIAIIVFGVAFIVGIIGGILLAGGIEVINLEESQANNIIRQQERLCNNQIKDLNNSWNITHINKVIDLENKITQTTNIRYWTLSQWDLCEKRNVEAKEIIRDMNKIIIDGNCLD